MNLNERKVSKTNSRSRLFDYSIIRLFPVSIIRLFDYFPFRLFDYSIIRLFPVSIIRLFDYSIIRKAARGFTLIEVNLAMLIMAGGILSIVGLYAFGFRENRQSREDVTATAFADAVVSPLAMMIGSTNVTWANFRRQFYYPNEKGWGYYFNGKGVVTTPPDGEGAFGEVQRWLGVSGRDAPNFPSDARPNNTSCGVVIMHPEDSATATIGFRAVPTDRPGMLLAMPLFFTEVRFQGVVE